MVETDSQRTLMSQNGLALPPLTYHEITETSTAYRYAISAARFSEHVSVLQHYRAKRKRPLITFDDGHVSQLANAVPILKRFDEQAVFFITAGWTAKRAGYMNWNHLRELRASGYEVQSHGWSHILLTECSLPELENELTRSKGELQDRIGATVDAISMPGGRWNAHVLRACVAAGYSRVFTSNPWNGHSLPRVSTVGRWMITRNMSAQDVLALLQRKGSLVQLLRMRYRLTEFAKSFIGEKAYSTLWRAISHKHESLEHSQQNYDFSADEGCQ